MKKKLVRKLTLSRESLSLLETQALRRIEGAARTDGECTIGLTHCGPCP
jgi:hypothetical protein